MAEVIIQGVLYDKQSKTGRAVALIGDATLTSPPQAPGGPVDPGYGVPTPPEQIWGGRPPSGNWPGWGPPPAWWPGHPSHPIPPGIWPTPPGPKPPDTGAHPEHPIVLPGDPSWGDPHPEHPIVLPPPNLPGPPPDNAVKPPPEGGGWGYWYPYGWAYVPGQSQPGPKG